MGTSQTVKMKSVSVKDVDQHKFVRALAAFFKKSGKVKQPEWTDLVKTAVFKELAPFDEDWFYIRMASLVRHIYIRSPIGVKTVKPFTEDTRTMVLPPPTSAPALDQLPAK